MAQSYTNLLYHIIFSIRHRRPWIDAQIRPRLYPYIGGTIRGLGGIGLEIGGTPDHLHLLARLPPIIALSDFVGKLKASSSKWMKEACRRFAWQSGYAALTVSESQVDRVRRYIARQEEHHKRVSFQEELAQWLQAHAMTQDTSLRCYSLPPAKRRRALVEI